MENNRRRKRVFLSDFIISCLVIALVFGIGGFIAGRLTALRELYTQDTEKQINAISENESSVYSVYEETPSSIQDKPSETPAPTQSISHFTCNKCQYSFNDLSELRLEKSGSIHMYYCPTCGEVLTSDMNGNALTALSYHDYYKTKVTDNWNGDNG